MTPDSPDWPICEVAFCCKPAQDANGINHPRGSKPRKSVWVREEYLVENGYTCASCHGKRIAKNRGLPSMAHVMAKNAGFDSVTAYTNSMHPYLKYRKNYCENIDGRLGFKCTFTAPTPEQLTSIGMREDYQGWLQVDHIDGNHLNNDESNLQTLCACCHNVKTFANGDHATPGRKTRKKD